MFCEKAICDKANANLESPCSLCQSPGHPAYIAAKTLLEWVASLVMLVLLSPMIAMLAVLVRLSSDGPAFYWQVRLGLYGKPYRIYKLRTMSHNCEAKTGAVWSSGVNDPRVTRLGRFLRETHLDELPQLWNVLLGDMSLIGPRPERPEIASRLDQSLPRYSHRLMVRPGVTGLAQVQLPPDTDLESVRRKLAYDLYYVQEIGAMLDARILFATFFHFLASAINAVGAALVKSEKMAVESGKLVQIKAHDGLRAGAA